MKFDKTKIIYNLDNLEHLLFDSKKETAKEIATRIKHKIFTDKKIYNAFCKFPNSILSIEKDLKTSKNSKNGYITGIQYLYNLKQFCSHAKIANCFKTCIVHTGNAIVFLNINIFRLVKALFKIQYPKNSGICGTTELPSCLSLWSLPGIFCDTLGMCSGSSIQSLFEC